MEFARRPKLACSSLQIVLTFRLSHPLRIFSFHSGRGNSRIPVLRVIEPAAHAEPAQSSPEVVGAVRLPWPHRIWPRLHSDTAVHGHLLPHSLFIEGVRVGRWRVGGGGGGRGGGRGRRRRGGGGGGRDRHHCGSGGPSGFVHLRRAAGSAITRSRRRRRPLGEGLRRVIGGGVCRIQIGRAHV